MKKQNDLVALSDLPNVTKDIVESMPEHKAMIESINKNLPEIKRATSLFGKTQSQFMDNMLTVSHYTPLRNLRQILAQVTQTRAAIDENNFKLKKKQIEIKMKQRELEEEKDALKKEMLQTEIAEMESQLENAKIYISGSIRTLSNYTEQYNNIVTSKRIKTWNEKDFEAEEEKYHIMKAFEQGYCAAVSGRGGFDEGNTIYVTQLGINGMAAQKDLQEYLMLEDSLLKDSKEPTHKMFSMFLERMAEKHKGCSTAHAERKGMTTYTEKAAIEKGDVTNKHIELMKKLYALAKENNGSESDSALKKLQKLLKKHKIDLLDFEKLL
jgi:hypothetical protein